MCPNCRAFITTEDKVCPYCDMEIGARAIDRRSPPDILGGLIPHAHFTTIVILLINFGLYVAMMLRTLNSGGNVGMDIDPQTLLDFGAKYRRAIFLGQYWRLITAGFLHGGLMHILMNSWVLFDLGAQVEEAYGTPRFIAFYVITTITGFLASNYWSSALSIGSSAGIFGLIGAMIAMGVRDRSAYGSAVRSVYMRWAIYSLVMGLLPFFATDNAAHIGGIAGGFAVAYVAGTPGFSQTTERVWQVIAGICLAMTGYAFLRMILWLLSAN